MWTAEEARAKSQEWIVRQKKAKEERDSKVLLDKECCKLFLSPFLEQKIKEATSLGEQEIRMTLRSVMLKVGGGTPYSLTAKQSEGVASTILEAMGELLPNYKIKFIDYYYFYRNRYVDDGICSLDSTRDGFFYVSWKEGWSSWFFGLFRKKRG